jgi:uncharacterized protein
LTGRNRADRGHKFASGGQYGDMAVLPKSLLWRRLDSAGAEQSLIADSSGLHARATIVCADPVPFVCRYELYTDDTWATARFEASVEGAGFARTVRLERAAQRWRATASEQGDLDAALVAAGRARAGMPGADDANRLASAVDVDVAYSALTNTLPVRRLGLLNGAAGTTHQVDTAWVLLPGLEVMPNRQSYTWMGDGRVRFTSGTFTADLTFDANGYVMHYPGLAARD